MTAQTIMTGDHHEVAARQAQDLSDNAPMPIISSVTYSTNSNTEMKTLTACSAGENMICPAGPVNKVGRRPVERARRRPKARTQRNQAAKDDGQDRQHGNASRLRPRWR